MEPIMKKILFLVFLLLALPVVAQSTSVCDNSKIEVINSTPYILNIIRLTPALNSTLTANKTLLAPGESTFLIAQSGKGSKGQMKGRVTIARQDIPEKNVEIFYKFYPEYILIRNKGKCKANDLTPDTVEALFTVSSKQNGKPASLTYTVYSIAEMLS